MRIVGFGTYDTTKHPRVGVLLEGLAAAGDEVIEVNAPLRLSTADRVAMLQRPWRLWRLVALLAQLWWQLLQGARAARRAGPIDAVLVGYLGHFDVLLARCCFPRTTIVLDQMIFAADTAQDRGVSSGAKLSLLRGLDWLATAAATVVVVDTAEHLELCSKRARPRAIVVPVGAPEAWRAARPETPPGTGGGPLRVIFYGLFTPLQGATTLGEALGLLRDREDIVATLVGSGQDAPAALAAARANPRVTEVAWVDADELPALVAEHDVCLGIFGTTDKAQRVVPNKVYQGAALGRCLVTSSTAPQRQAFDGAACFVAPGSPAELADALVQLATDRARVEALGLAAAQRSDHAFSSSAIVAQLRAELQRNGR